ncbi:MAG: GntR family transcriptional regulator [Bacteroidales bacterium]|jgi:DNA-binding GntR family transcriptional regulator|nr:GntR family transcriptional regulator [Bacteroidales bacterium]MDD3161509.1 GntR family transcriptional regulator [Bacteroidales bacterium]
MHVDFSQTAIAKFKVLSNAIAHAIQQGEFGMGEPLPSINVLSAEYSISRETVFKAFNDLKKRGLVDSAPTKGYFVAGEVNTVLLLLDAYSLFKELLYTNFVETLGKDYKVELIFHHYNQSLFDTILQDARGRYSYYIIMNVNDEKMAASIETLDPNKVLLLDMGDYDKKNLSYICQDFGQSFRDSLEEGVELFAKYKKLVLCLRNDSPHPRVCVPFFKRFCRDHHIACQVRTQVMRLNDVEENVAYLSPVTSEVVELIKFCRKRKLVVGKDVGVVAYNDMPLYEVIDKGITSISVDFALMGERAARHILDKKKSFEILPARLIRRESL